MNRPLSLLGFVLGLGLISPAHASTWGPWDRPATSPASRSEAPSGMSLPFMGMIRGYQLILSTQDAASCPMYPSCSRFSMEAFARYGPVQGLLMTADRFIRENDDVHAHYPPVQLNNRVLFLDPPTERHLW